MVQPASAPALDFICINGIGIRVRRLWKTQNRMATELNSLQRAPRPSWRSLGGNLQLHYVTEKWSNAEYVTAPSDYGSSNGSTTMNPGWFAGRTWSRRKLWQSNKIQKQKFIGLPQKRLLPERSMYFMSIAVILNLLCWLLFNTILAFGHFNLFSFGKYLFKINYFV